jgi:peptide chain release factor subunit 1
LQPIVDWLTDLGTSEHWVVSCYLKLEPRDRSRGKYLIKLKNRVKGQLKWLEQRSVTRQERETVERDLERVREYLENPGNLGTGQGIALFACEPQHLFEAIPLPWVFRSRLSVDHSPLVREAAALNDEFGRVLCAVYDRTTARLFTVTAFGIEELPSLTAGDTTRAGRFHGPSGVAGPGFGAAGEHRFHQRIREEKQRHYAGIAHRLFEASREQAVRGIVLAGMGADADAVEPHLHPYLATQVLGTAKLNPKTTTPAEVMEAVLAVRRQSERQLETGHVDALYERLGTGWAVNGIEPVLKSLAQGQVRTLFVDPATEQAGFRCDGSGRLAIDRGACHGEGEPEAVPDVVDEAIEDALRQGSTVEVVEDDTARNRVDGLAAVLRFKTQ